MKSSRSVYAKVAAIALALAAAGTASVAQARSDVFFSIGANVAPGVSLGVTNAAPVYVAPPPVYMVPQPVYVQPAPVYYGATYVAPAPVIYGAGYIGPRHRRHFRHEGWREHEHEGHGRR